MKWARVRKGKGGSYAPALSFIDLCMTTDIMKITENFLIVLFV